MAKEIDMYKAREVYETLISMLDSRQWTYDKYEDELIVKSGVKSEDLPIEFFIVVNPKNEVVQFISRLPFTVPEEKRVELAIAVCVANYGLIDGSFDYDISDGEIRFRLTTSYCGSEISEELFGYIITVAASTVDDYNDKFFMVVKDMMTVEQFIEKENN